MTKFRSILSKLIKKHQNRIIKNTSNNKKNNENYATLENLSCRNLFKNIYNLFTTPHCVRSEITNCFATTAGVFPCVFFSVKFRCQPSRWPTKWPNLILWSVAQEIHTPIISSTRGKNRDWPTNDSNLSIFWFNYLTIFSIYFSLSLLFINTYIAMLCSRKILFYLQ